MPTPLSHRPSFASRPAPGLRWGSYPQRDEPQTVRAPRRAAAVPALMLKRRLGRQLRQIWQYSAGWRELGDTEFLSLKSPLQARLLREGMAPGVLCEACAFVAEAARRVLAMEAYGGQLMAVLAMLDNRLVEMATGEGKTLSAALAAAVGALAGIPVHVLTANDYLVTRDAEAYRPLFAWLGLSVASVVAGQAGEDRRTAYAQAIVYVTARELAFDYLRDRLATGQGEHALQRRASAMASPQAAWPLLRGLCMAVIDEADNILIDEAQMPLILSRQANGAAARAYLWQAFALSGRLDAEIDFLHHATERRIELTPAGRAHIGELARHLAPVWRNTRHREDSLVAALTARYVFERDRDYVVAEGEKGPEIQIVDALSGRIDAARKWSQGLHAFVGIKEGCQTEAEAEPLAQITFQRFFRRYHRFGGMSGTLTEARGELRALFGASTVHIPRRRPDLRQAQRTRLFASDAARWEAVVARTRDLSNAGRPVLIGCDSVAASHALSLRLQQAGITHAVLNATAHRDEAHTVACAGQAGQVTVSTNMAGRGTDIRPDDRALAAGGLHVLNCQHNASHRHDRQLSGRAGRQGQPGSHETWLSLASKPFQATVTARLFASLARRFLRDGEVRLPGGLLAAWLRGQQSANEHHQSLQRRHLLEQDRALDNGLAFSARKESP